MGSISTATERVIGFSVVGAAVPASGRLGKMGMFAERQAGGKRGEGVCGFALMPSRHGHIGDSA
ncbi:hypothetical protein [Frateuria defendens]|uniref:hypothetical protein n=1 Tax=Frateuria defendens TaxID=2219559 RepID=UPI001293D6D3|nr:hypothetical protein [Frateuria defendens]